MGSGKIATYRTHNTRRNTVSNLTLKQMQDLGINKFMNDKEVQTQLGKALLAHEESKQEQPSKPNTLEGVLTNGGVIKYKHNNKVYSISVLTASDYGMYERQQMEIEDGVEYSLPPMYKFHIKNALDNRVTVRAKTYTEAQSVVDSIYGKSVYKVSASSF